MDNNTKFNLLKKSFENNLRVMHDYWFSLIDVSFHTDEFLEKSSVHLDTPEGRAADSLFWMIGDEFDKLYKQFKKEMWDLYKKYCSFPVDESYIPNSLPHVWVVKNTEPEQIMFFTATFELFEKWINIINDKSTQHKIIVKSTLHTLDMALLTK